MVLTLSALLLSNLGANNKAALYGLPALLCGTVLLHIQVSFGTTEWHFGMFVTLAVVMIYRNPRVLLVCAGLFTAHHVLFDRLQALGWNLYCTSEPNLPRVVLHISFLVVQTAVQWWIVQWLNQGMRQGEELEALVTASHTNGQVRLNVEHRPVHTPLGRVLHSMLTHLDIVHTTMQAGEHTSAQLANHSHELAQRTAQASLALQDSQQRIYQLLQQAQDAHALAQQGQRRAHAAILASRNSLDLPCQLDARMHSVVQHIDAIASMKDTVQELTFQTNLLALNAAVKAAHHGVQEHSFAVMAKDVKALAERSTAVSQAMQQLVHAAQSSMADCAALGRATANCLHMQHIATQQSAQDLSTIESAALRQQTTLGTINLHMGVLDQAMTYNTALAQSTTSTTDTLRLQVQQVLNSLKTVATVASTAS